MTLKNWVLLALPFIWFLYLWTEFVFGVHINIDFIPFTIWFLFLVFGTPVIALIGLIYTYRKKLWWWFSGYILGGFPIIYYFIAVLIY